MGKKRTCDKVIEEYKPKRRCETEGCKNRRSVENKCLSCYYSYKKKKINEKNK